jgi:thiol:disulfide interchange protein
MFLVVQTDPMMAQVRAQYESDKAAAQKRQVVRTNKTTKKTQTANTSTRKKTTRTASGDVPYKPRSKGTRVNSGDSALGAFVGGALLGAAVGAAVGH